MYEENLNPTSITKGLTAHFIGQNVLYYPSVTSTNDIARQQALLKAPEGTAVIADRQTTGRGRLKREWVSPPGNIAVTVVLYPARNNLTYLTMLAALAVLYSIEKTTGLHCQLKWPNDVLINNKKVCGILLESHVAADFVDYAIIGIGINVNMKLADYPEIASIATSLADEVGEEVSRLTLLHNLSRKWKNYIYVYKPVNQFWQNGVITWSQSAKKSTSVRVMRSLPAPPKQWLTMAACCCAATTAH